MQNTKEKIIINVSKNNKQCQQQLLIMRNDRLIFSLGFHRAVVWLCTNQSSKKKIKVNLVCTDDDAKTVIDAASIINMYFLVFVPIGLTF